MLASSSSSSYAASVAAVAAAGSALLLLAGPTSTHAFSDADARSKSVYQLVTDRFALTSSSPSACNVSARSYCGGQWAGIGDHLQYIQGMGFDTSEFKPSLKKGLGLKALK